MAEGISAGCPYDDRSALTRVLSLNRWTAELDWTAVWTAVWFGVVRPPPTCSNGICLVARFGAVGCARGTYQLPYTSATERQLKRGTNRPLWGRVR